MHYKCCIFFFFTHMYLCVAVFHLHTRLTSSSFFLALSIRKGNKCMEKSYTYAFPIFLSFTLYTLKTNKYTDRNYCARIYMSAQLKKWNKCHTSTFMNLIVTCAQEIHMLLTVFSSYVASCIGKWNVVWKM